MATDNDFRKVRIFVASPGDVAKERESLRKVVESLNRRLANHFQIVLELVEWGQVVPDMGRPQQIILDQLPVNSWDIFIGILWLRFGTRTGAAHPDTGRPFESGTEEEFALALNEWRKTQRPRILFYRCLRLPQRLLDIDAAQFDKVSKFFAGFDANHGEHAGLYRVYDQPEDFKDYIWEHLTEILLLDAKLPAHLLADVAKSTWAPFLGAGLSVPPAIPLVVGAILKNAGGQPAKQTDAFHNPFIVGRPITDPADFFGREKEIGFCVARLRTMQSVSIVGERRIGKTSLLHYLLATAAQRLGPEYRTAFLDLQLPCCRSLATLLTQILSQLGLEKPATSLSDFTERLQGLHRDGVRPLIAMDEVEILTRFPAEFSRDFFETLRAVASAGQIALLTGSRQSLKELHDDGSLVSPLHNILGVQRLGGFTADEAREFVSLPRVGVKFTPEQVETILEKGRQHPLRLQVLCWHAAQAARYPQPDWQRAWEEAEVELGQMVAS